jgi:hypothetical protein
MKKARLILTTSMFALMGLSAITISSCTKDETCPAGYEGKNCDVQIRTAMLGTYNATDENVTNPNASPNPYNPVISTNASVTVVNIKSFSDFFSGSEIVTSNVSKSGDNINFTIPAQKPDNVYEVSGSGTYNAANKTINIEYSLKNPLGDIDNYTGVWTKQ